MLTALSWHGVTAGGVALFSRRHIDLCRVTTASCPTGMRHR
jgi:hypothetical protein